jgi:hypothetical protein
MIDCNGKSRLDRRMKSKSFLLCLAVWFAAGAFCFAADDPNMGTWKLNEAKSKFTPGTQKNNTVTYEMSGDKMKVTADGVDGKGSPVHSEWTGMFDGKDHPVTGNPNEDTRSYRKASDGTLEFTSKKDGKILVSGRVVVAPDGKSRTVTTTGTDANGKKFKNKGVFDKQ